jgi:hypothetical protein
MIKLIFASQIYKTIKKRRNQNSFCKYPEILLQYNNYFVYHLFGESKKQAAEHDIDKRKISGTLIIGKKEHALQNVEKEKRRS